MLKPLSNPKHERFAQELASGKSAEDAYVIAGYRDHRCNASRMKTKDTILHRVEELLAEREAIHAQATAQAIKSTGLTKAWVIETLQQNVARAMQAVPADNGLGEYQYQGSVANKALELLGKEIGMFVERKEVGRPGEFESMNADELREYISRESAKLGLSAPAPPQLNGSGKPH